MGEKHKEALATLKYGILGNKGILLLTGDVGTGKTTLINALLNSLDQNTIVATVPDPGLEKLDFFNFVARAFDINKTFSTKGEFKLYLSHFLKNAYAENKKVLLIIDEAQRLNKDLLEEIRLLSNIELQHTKLINLFFVGQKEFNDIILLDENKALRQRITLRYNIEPLNAEETREYLKYRLQVAGSKKNLFTTSAVSEIFAFSKGYPRLINVISDYALLTGFVQDKKTIDRQIIRECATELKIPDKTEKADPPGPVQAATESMESMDNGRRYAPALETDPGVKPERRPLFSKAMAAVLIPLLLLSVGFLFYYTATGITPFGAMARFRQNIGPYMNSLKWSKEAPQPIQIISGAESATAGEVEAARTNRETAPTREIILPTKPRTKGSDPGQPINTRPVSRADSPMRIPSSPDMIPAEKGKGEENADKVDTPPIASITPPAPSAALIQPKPAEGNRVAAVEQNRAVQPMGISYESSVYSASVKAPENRSSQLDALADATADAAKPKKIVVFFDYNSFSLNRQAINELDKLITVVEKNPESDVVIKGFTDNNGPYVYNERLSIFRAFSVKSYLVENGIDPLKARAYGMGPKSPVDESGNIIPPEFTRSAEVEVRLGKNVNP